MIKIAVIGVGSMGAHHARVYAELKDAKLVAVVDTDKTTAESVGKKYSCNHYTDYKEMLKKESIDAVSVVVPTKFHWAIASEVLKQKKHVLVEKPIASTIEEANTLLTLAKKNSVHLMVGHIERFNPAVHKLKELIKEKKLGDITSIAAIRVGLFPPRVQDANIVIDVSIHDIDILNYLVGEVPKNVFATGGKALTSSREDYVNLLLQYSRASGVVQSNWLTPIKIRTLSVTGTKGYAELNYISQELVHYESHFKKANGDFDSFLLSTQPTKVVVDIPKDEPLKRELAHFVDIITKNVEPIMKPEEAVAALSIALDATKKLR